MNRRSFSLGLAASAALAPFVLSDALAQTPGAKVPVEALMAPNSLPDLALGSKDAKVTVVEYASLTCGHCATFHEKTFPAFKTKYIDSGKVRFILREFPLDPLAAGGFMLARCAGETGGESRYHAMVDLLFKQQKGWAFAEKPVDALAALVKQAGISQEAFESCLTNQKNLDAVLAVKNRGQNEFKVDSTPTFFVNGTMYKGALSIEDFDKILTPLLGS
ncbi:MAG: DsbA family protein [Sphingomonadales bacterium]|nr:DsbA family protein [Sphingomonadales bacterium]